MNSLSIASGTGSRENVFCQYEAACGIEGTEQIFYINAMRPGGGGDDNKKTTTQTRGRN